MRKNLEAKRPFRKVMNYFSKRRGIELEVMKMTREAKLINFAI